MSQRQRQLHEEIKKFIVNVFWTHKIQVVYSKDILASYAKWVRVGFNPFCYCFIRLNLYFVE